MLTWGVMGPDLPEHTVSISPFIWLEEDNALHGLSFPKPPSPFISSRLVHWRSNYWDLSASNQVHQTESSDWKERQTYQWGWINHSIVVKVKQGRNKETPNTTTSTKSEETIHIFQQLLSGLNSAVKRRIYSYTGLNTGSFCYSEDTQNGGVPELNAIIGQVNLKISAKHFIQTLENTQLMKLSKTHTHTRAST